MDEQERIEIDPRELEALQRARDFLANIDEDSQSPESVSMPEEPAAAEQPVADVVAPEIGPIQVELPEPAKPLLDTIPDIPSTPAPKPLNAFQKRQRQKVAPQQPLPVPAQPAVPEQPNPEPPKLVAPDLKGVVAEAQRVGAFEEKEEVVAWNRFLGQDNGQRLGNADNVQGNHEEAFKNLADRLAKLLTVATEVVDDLAKDIDKLRTEQIRIRNGNLRSRG